jgi:hypothetical protein
MGRRGKKAAGGEKTIIGLRALDLSHFGGVPKEMRENQLPLIKDVGLHEEKLELTGMSRPEAVQKTAEKVETIYQTASIPCLPNRSIQRKVKKLLVLKREREQETVKHKKSGKVKCQGKFARKKRNNKFKQKLGDVLEKIFDVKTEIPDLEKKFDEDQCNERKMIIGSLDIKETKRREAKIMKATVVEMNKRKLKKSAEKRKRREDEEKEIRFKKVEGGAGEVEKMEDEVNRAKEPNDEEVRFGKGVRCGPLTVARREECQV